MKTYTVTLPFAGHMNLNVEASTEEEAVQVAINDCTRDDIESWEAMERFNSGNVCYCPRPWAAEVELAYDIDVDESDAEGK